MLMCTVILSKITLFSGFENCNFGNNQSAQLKIYWGLVIFGHIRNTLHIAFLKHCWGFYKVHVGMFWGVYLKILKSWSISESPWNRGFLVASSAKMVPVLQMSTGVEYLGEPRRTSGARYHSVTTWKHKRVHSAEGVNVKARSCISPYTAFTQS